MSAAGAGIGSWIIAILTLRAKVRTSHDEVVTTTASAEFAERAAFRDALMKDITSLRAAMRECEIDRAAIRERLVAAEERTLELKANLVTTSRWVEFFKQRETAEKGPVS